MFLETAAISIEFNNVDSNDLAGYEERTQIFCSEYIFTTLKDLLLSLALVTARFADLLCRTKFSKTCVEVRWPKPEKEGGALGSAAEKARP